MINPPARRTSRFWPGMVFALIGLNVCMVAVTVFAASARRSSFAVEPDYDRKALHWNDAARQLEHNKELGWTLRLGEVGSAGMGVSLIDRDGHPIMDADVSVEAFHHAHAGDKVNAALTPSNTGGYAGPVKIDVPGIWEFRFTVRHGPDTFTSAMTRIIAGVGS